MKQKHLAGMQVPRIALLSCSVVLWNVTFRLDVFSEFAGVLALQANGFRYIGDFSMSCAHHQNISSRAFGVGLGTSLAPSFGYGSCPIL